MELKDFLKQVHRIIEVKNGKDYNYKDIAKLIGANSRTYGEYLRGGITPLSMKTLLNLLTNLNDKDLVKVIRLWEEENIINKRKGK